MARLDLARGGLMRRAAPDLAAPAARLRAWAIGLLGACVIVMGLGSTWDVKWHYAVGRDSFWIPPHLSLYVSVALSGLLCASVVLYETWLDRRARHDAARLLGFSGPPGLFVSGFGVAVILLAAPFDDLWHRLYGIDVTIWSPPHMLGLLGGGIVIFGGLIAAAREWREHNGRGMGIALPLFLMALVSLGSFVLIPAHRLSFWPHAVTPARDPFHGNLLFYPVLASLLLAWPLAAAARLFARRWGWLAPLLVLAAFVLLNLLEIVTGRIGFALFIPWGDQVFVRPPVVIERALWEHPILLAPPTVALSLILLLSRRRRFTAIAALAGLAFGLVLMLESLLLFVLRNPRDLVDTATLVLGFALALALGAISGAVGALVGGWLGGAATDAREVI